MSDKEKLLNNIKIFYSEIVEEYKEVTLLIRQDSTPMAIFKKKNYQGHIDRLRACKKQILRVNPKGMRFGAGEEEWKKLLETFEHALMMFGGLCDHQIQVQVSLQNTANKTGTKFSDCSDATKKLNQHNKETQAVFHQLDVQYADCLERK